jgi:tetratricopeptide (TPR) repeat protein
LNRERQREIFEQVQVRLRQRDLDGALTLAEQGLQQFPADANLMCLAARAGVGLERLDEARVHANNAIRLFPEFALAHDVLGDILLADNKPADALAAYQESMRLDPSRQFAQEKIERANSLARSLAGVYRAPGGRLPRRQVAFAGKISEAQEHTRIGEQNKAETIYRDILRVEPDHVEAARLLAEIAAAHEQYREAEVFLRHALKVAPDYARAWVDLANVQRELEDFAEAIASAEKVLALAPDKAESHMLCASMFGAAGQYDEAIRAYESALLLAPDKAGAMCSMAHHLKTIGKGDEAIARYRACIATRPDYSEAYWSLANLKTFRFEDSEVAAMHELLESDDLTDENRAQIHNALGLHYEARENFDKAFENFELCNILRRKAESYDPVDTEATHTRVIELFDEKFVSQTSGPDVEPVPIFIVGLPRSGSTLIEQILASHSSVEGTHELSDLSRVTRALRQRLQRDLLFPDFLKPFRADQWTSLGAQYIESTAKHRTGSVFFVDKNPNNFIFAGLIRLALPNAKIINARRHPLDSCLGSFKQLFASGQPFSYDLTELGEYYLQYQRLMDHWHRVLPGFILDVHYENVVNDFESEVRRLLAFCGLPFEESCLRFHETERAVKTASSEQVRQPIYSSSVNLWRNYENHLETLVHIVEPLLSRSTGAAAPPDRFQAK